jgi:uncharacterized protein YerC
VATVSTVDELFRSYTERTGIAQTAQRDAQFNYSLDVLRDVLQRLEVILDDEGIDQAVATRILRCLLYGAPSEADALDRIRQHEEETMRQMMAGPVLYGIALDGLGEKP